MEREHIVLGLIGLELWWLPWQHKAHKDFIMGPIKKTIQFETTRNSRVTLLVKIHVWL